MDLDIEQYNDLSPDLGHVEYCISVVAGVCTQVIDTPVTRSSILYENSGTKFACHEMEQLSSSLMANVSCSALLLLI